jgi:3',5'-cyclic AMP phosphodiesterase CpdA
MSFTLAHLSDLHLPIPPGALHPLGQLAGKRLLAYLAWRRKRRGAAAADRAAAGALAAGLAAAAPDHIVVTGDLTNLALPGEFAAARDWLAGLGPPAGVTVIPGNHDATVAVPWARGIGLWRDWMGDAPGEAAASGDPAVAPFPFLRRRGPLALIGLSSAVPTLPGSAAGWLGAAQLARLPALLEQARAEGLCRVLLLHHPPLPGPGGWRKSLRDRAALGAVLARHGAELVLHGHHHRWLRGALPGGIPVAGAPQALHAGGGPGRAAPGWLLHRFERHRDGWRVATELRTAGQPQPRRATEQ